MNVPSVSLGLLILVQINTSRLLEQLADAVPSVLGLWSAQLMPIFALRHRFILRIGWMAYRFVAGNGWWMLDQCACFLQESQTGVLDVSLPLCRRFRMRAELALVLQVFESRRGGWRAQSRITEWRSTSRCPISSSSLICLLVL